MDQVNTGIYKYEIQDINDTKYYEKNYNKKQLSSLLILSMNETHILQSSLDNITKYIEEKIKEYQEINPHILKAYQDLLNKIKDSNAQM